MVTFFLSIFRFCYLQRVPKFYISRSFIKFYYLFGVRKTIICSQRLHAEAGSISEDAHGFDMIHS